MTYKQLLAKYAKRRASINSMLAKGLSQTAVAKAFKISRQRVHKIAQEANGNAR